jgi:hypothetical protein
VRINASGIVKGNTVFGFAGSIGGKSGAGIEATGVVTGNYVAVSGTGIAASGIVTDNYVTNIFLAGISIGQGSTVISNTAFGALVGIVGINVSFPSNVTNNKAIGFGLHNLQLSGTGGSNTNNVAP